MTEQRRPTRANAGPRLREPDRKARDSWAAELAEARSKIALAVVICGLADGEHLTCPWCGTSKPGKVEVKAEKNYLTCYKCQKAIKAVDLVMEKKGLSVRAAVDLLNGKIRKDGESEEAYTNRIATMESRVAGLMKPAFRAELTKATVDVYNSVLSSPFVSLAGAQDYYSTWHISREAVASVGFVLIHDPDKLGEELVREHGKLALVKSGIAKESDERGGSLRFMFSANYPVVEPQIAPTGNCMSMQFRPSLRQKAKITAHKAGKGEYVPSFMSLRGATPEHLIGIGLDRLVKIKPTRVDVVEGAKDVAADITMGNEAFGMAGTNVLPPAQSVRALAKAGHTLRICMDGDTAGKESQQRVLDHFVAHGFPKERIGIHPMPEGLDITDILVRHNATRGCECATCSAFRG